MKNSSERRSDRSEQPLSYRRASGVLDGMRGRVVGGVTALLAAAGSLVAVQNNKNIPPPIPNVQNQYPETEIGKVLPGESLVGRELFRFQNEFKREKKIPLVIKPEHKSGELVFHVDGVAWKVLSGYPTHSREFPDTKHGYPMLFRDDEKPVNMWVSAKRHLCIQTMTPDNQWGSLYEFEPEIGESMLQQIGSAADQCATIFPYEGEMRCLNFERVHEERQQKNSDTLAFND